MGRILLLMVVLFCSRGSVVGGRGCMGRVWGCRWYLVAINRICEGLKVFLRGSNCPMKAPLRARKNTANITRLFRHIREMIIKRNTNHINQSRNT